MKILYGVLGAMVFVVFLSFEVEAQDIPFMKESERIDTIKQLYLFSMVNPEEMGPSLDVMRKHGLMTQCIQSFRSKMIAAGRQLDNTCRAFKYGSEGYQNCLKENPPDKLRRWADSVLKSLKKSAVKELLWPEESLYTSWPRTPAGSAALNIKNVLGAPAYEQLVLTVFRIYEPFIENYPCDIQ